MIRLLLLAVLCTAWGDARPADVLTESEAVERGLRVPAYLDWVEATRREARGQTAATGLWANPDLEYSEESLDVPGDSTDRFLWLRQSVDIAGVKSLKRASARQAEGVTEAHIETAKRERKAQVRRAFYQALTARRRVEAIEHWHGRLGELADAVGERFQAGDASRFDHLRLEREKVLLQGRLASARAEFAAASGRLFGLLESGRRPLAGELLPSPPPPMERVVESLDTHPEIRGLLAGAESDRLRAKAAGRESWPEVTLGVGRRELDEGRTSLDGNVFSVGVEIPLFDRGDGRESAARASSSAKSARVALARSRLRADLEASLEALRERRKAALGLERQLEAGGESLSGIADAAYESGELEVMGLIDAHQAELDLRLASIDLSHAARKAAIEFQTLTGD